MLVITLRPGEGVLIGNNVSVAILGVRQGRVRLGISAPRRIQIARVERERNARTKPDKPDA